MKPIKNYHIALLSLLVLLVVTTFSVLAQQRGAQQQPAEQPQQHEQTVDEGKSSARGSSHLHVISVTSPFDSLPQAAVGNAVSSPFDSPLTLAGAGAVHSLDDAQSNAAVSAPVIISPFSSSENPDGVTTVSDPFDTANQASEGMVISNSSVAPTRPVESLDQSRNEAVAERQEQPETTLGSGEALETGHAGTWELFGGSYEPRLSGDDAPAYGGEGWTPWYALEATDGTSIADVEIAYKRVGVQGAARERMVRWVPRNRSRTSLTVEYEMEIRCADQSAAGRHTLRALLPAGRSVRGGERGGCQIWGARVVRVGAGEGRKIVGVAR